MAPHSSTLAWKILWTEEPGEQMKSKFNFMEKTQGQRIHTMEKYIRQKWITYIFFDCSG